MRGAVANWQTSAGGGCWSVGVGGSLTGRGAHLLLLDDPVKDSEEANSLVMRDKLYEWYRSTFITRCEPDASLVIVQTRWHEDDLTGKLLTAEYQSSSRENWNIISLPALYESDHADSLPANCTVEPDFRTVEGEALCPERYPAKRLLHTKAQIGDYHFGALYQQRPTSPAGVLFDVTKLTFVDAAPQAIEQRIRSWDKASTEGGGDFTAGVRMSKDKDGIYYIEHTERGQWGTAKRDRIIRYIAELDGKRCRVIGEQEPGSSGVDAAGAFIKLLGGFSVETEPSTGSKEVRADPFSSQVNAGNVCIVRGEWNAAFVEELRQFPRGRHDDQVDAASLAFNKLASRQEWVMSRRTIR